MRQSVGDALQPIGAEFQEAFADFVENITPFLAENLPKIAGFVLDLSKNLVPLAGAIGGVSAALAILKVQALLASGGMTALASAIGAANAVALVNPYVALAAGVGLLTAKLIGAVNKQRELNNLIKGQGTLEQFNNRYQEIEGQITAAQEKLTGQTGRQAQATRNRINQLKSSLSDLEKVRGKFEQAVPEQEKITPSDFPDPTGKDSGSGRAKKERESQLPQLKAQLETRRQIAEIDKRINNAQLMENQMLQIRLEGEKTLIRLAGQYKAVEFEKIPDNEKQIKQLLVMEDIEQARLDIAQKLAVANKQALKEIGQGSMNLKESYEDQATAVMKIKELTANGVNKALAEQYIEIEKIIDKEREQYEARIAQLEEIRKLGGPGAVQAGIDIGLLRGEAAGLESKEGLLKRLAGAAQPAEENKIKEFVRNSEEEIKDLEALAVRVSENIGNAIGSSISNGISGLIEGTTTAKEVFANFLKDIGQILVQEGAKLIATYVAIGIAKAFAGLTSGSSSKPTAPVGPIQSGSDFRLPGTVSTGIFPAAKGAAFSENGIQPFGYGGIVTKPTFFKFANGGSVGTGGSDSIPFQMGVMGEAGPEAIMPLKRGADGKLGVTAQMPAFAGMQGSSIPFTKTTERMISERSERETVAAINNPKPLDVRYESQVINGVEYVTAEQHQKGMTQAAERGRALALSALQNSVKSRKRVGI